MPEPSILAYAARSGSRKDAAAPVRGVRGVLSCPSELLGGSTGSLLWGFQCPQTANSLSLKSCHFNSSGRAFKHKVNSPSKYRTTLLLKGSCPICSDLAFIRVRKPSEGQQCLPGAASVQRLPCVTHAHRIIDLLIPWQGGRMREKRLFRRRKTGTR